jgi:hypothetical protein
MNFRRFANILFAASTLLLTSYNLFSSRVLSYYSSGRGLEFLECVKNQSKQEFERIGLFVGIEDRTLPGFRYDILPKEIGGFYSSNWDSITFDSSRVLVTNNIVQCKYHLRHELGHAVLNEKSQEIGNGKWPLVSTVDRIKFSLRDYGLELISEGLTNYISNGIRSTNLKEKWPRNRGEFYRGNSYRLGNYLITDIMNEFGAAAIPFIIENPPTERQILSPLIYKADMRQLIRNSQRRR